MLLGAHIPMYFNNSIIETYLLIRLYIGPPAARARRRPLKLFAVTVRAYTRAR
jgi:hypothetical protein